MGKRSPKVYYNLMLSSWTAMDEQRATTVDKPLTQNRTTTKSKPKPPLQKFC